MQTAAATLAGNALGAKDWKKLRDLERAIIPLETGLMTVCGALLFAFAPQLMTLFSRDAEALYNFRECACLNFSHDGRSFIPERVRS